MPVLTILSPANLNSLLLAAPSAKPMHSISEYDGELPSVSKLPPKAHKITKPTSSAKADPALKKSHRLKSKDLYSKKKIMTRILAHKVNQANNSLELLVEFKSVATHLNSGQYVFTEAELLQ
jgi:hypothetical protein